MSNYLAIATVTAVMKRLLQEGVSQDVPGTQVTTVRPDAPSGNIAGACINLFLYHAIPNPAWRNADLRTRRPKGELVKHGQAGLDLHYLLTFYGNEQRLEPQRLLGSAVQTLVDHPLVTQKLIEDTLANANLPELAHSTLADQVQQVKFFPADITTEELSRIWSVFFQIPYSLSFAYQGTAVLIQGRKPGQTALPVRSRQYYVSPKRPVIERIENLGQPYEPITVTSTLSIRGRQLYSAHTQIEVDTVRLTPQLVEEIRLEVNLAALAPQESQHLQAGVQTLKVLHPSQETGNGIASNLLPFVLCPTLITEALALPLTDVEETETNRYSATVTVELDLAVTPQQQVYLLLNGSHPGESQGYVFAALHRSETSHHLSFELVDISPDTYLVRVQVDGAESPLIVDTDNQSRSFNQYVGPMISIG